MPEAPKVRILLGFSQDRNRLPGFAEAEVCLIFVFFVAVKANHLYRKALPSQVRRSDKRQAAQSHKCITLVQIQ